MADKKQNIRHNTETIATTSDKNKTHPSFKIQLIFRRMKKGITAIGAQANTKVFMDLDHDETMGKQNATGYISTTNEDVTGPTTNPPPNL